MALVKIPGSRWKNSASNIRTAISRSLMSPMSAIAQTIWQWLKRLGSDLSGFLIGYDRPMHGFEMVPAITKIPVEMIATYTPIELLQVLVEARSTIYGWCGQIAENDLVLMCPKIIGLQLESVELWGSKKLSEYLEESGWMKVYVHDRMPVDLVAIYTPRSIPVGVDPILVFLGEYPPVYPYEVVVLRGF